MEGGVGGGPRSKIVKAWSQLFKIVKTLCSTFHAPGEGNLEEETLSRGLRSCFGGRLVELSCF